MVSPSSPARSGDSSAGCFCETHRAPTERASVTRNSSRTQPRLHEESGNRGRFDSIRPPAISAGFDSRRTLREDQRRWPQRPSLLRARFAPRQKYSSDRRHGLHRQSVARKSPRRSPGNCSTSSCSSGATKQTPLSIVSAAWWKNRRCLTRSKSATAAGSQHFWPKKSKSSKATSASRDWGSSRNCASGWRRHWIWSSAAPG